MIQPQQNRGMGPREFFAIIVLTVGIKFTDTTPTILFQKTMNGAWILPFITGFIMLVIPFPFLLKLVKHYKDKGFIQIIFQITGKYFGTIISLVLFTIAFSATVIDSRGYVDIMNIMFYTQTDKIFLYSVFMFVIFFIAKLGFKVIGNTAWLSFPYIFAVFALAVVAIWGDLRINFLFPLGGPGIYDLLREGVLHSSIMGDLIFFSVIFPYIKDYKTYKFVSFFAYGFIIFELALFYAIYVMLFDFPGVMHIAYPFQEMTRILEMGVYVTNIEALFLGFWTLASVVRFSVYLYVSVAIFGYTFNMKDFRPLMLPFAALTVMLGMLPENPVESALILRAKYILNTTWVIIVFLPPLLWVIAKMRGEFKQ